jgi:hypothetical protein
VRTISPIDLSDAVWSLSMLSCSQAAGNKSAVTKPRSGRSTAIEAKPYNVYDPRQQHREAAVCGTCAVKELCKVCIPSAQYYVAGRMVITDQRTAFAESRLF